MVNYRFLSCFLSFTCFLLLLVAHCSHNWRTYYPFVGAYSMGLWTICSEVNGCRKLNTEDVAMEFTRTLMLVALIASLMAFIWAVEWDHLVHSSCIFLPKVLLASICNFVAGISVLIALVMFERESTLVPVTTISVKGWAFYLSCFINSLCFLIGLLNFAAYKWALWGKHGSHCGVSPQQGQTTGAPTVAPALL